MEGDLRAGSSPAPGTSRLAARIVGTGSMELNPETPSDLESIYRQRFDEHLTYRNQVWKVLATEYFSRFIPAGARVLDLGCGYGEFINNICCAKKLAMDMNPRARLHLAADVEFHEQDCTLPWPLPDESLDLVFTSNFFEHLASKQAMKLALGQAYRCLRRGGRIIIMGPNVRFTGGAYWDFWDHHLALTDVSMKEALTVLGFQVEKAVDRFLPYTMVNRRRAPMVMVRLYLRAPLLWKIFGKQFLVIGRK